MKTYCYRCGKTVEGETLCYCEFVRKKMKWIVSLAAPGLENLCRLMHPEIEVFFK